MSRLIEVLGALITMLLEYLLDGLIVIGLAGVIFAPLILFFATSGIVQSIALVLLIIEIIIAIGCLAQNF